MNIFISTSIYINRAFVRQAEECVCLSCVDLAALSAEGGDMFLCKVCT